MMQEKLETVGMIGLGQMGLPIAKNLVASGFRLRVYNRTPAKVVSLLALGAEQALAPEDAAPSGGLLLSMVSDDAALEAVCTHKLAEHLGAGGVHISMSTVAPITSARLAQLHASYGATYVAAPVFGRPDAAAARKLWVIVAGPAAAKARARPVFSAISQGVHDVGEKPEAANVVKLAGNFVAYAALESMAEAAALGEKNGVPRAALLSVLTQTLFSTPVYQTFARRIIEANFEQAEFTARLGLKDMLLARSAAEQSDAPMPILDLLCERYNEALADGHSDADATVLASSVARSANLTWWNGAKAPKQP